MADRRPDRRVRRTRSRLKQALLELLAERPYQAITIRDLTERADVGRSTFYSHYDSKEDLLFSGFDDWLLSLPDAAPVGEGIGPGGGSDPVRFRFSLPLLRHVRSQRRFFEAVMVRGSSVRVRRKVTNLVAEVVALELERMGVAMHSQVALAHALAGAWVGLVAWWLSGGDALSVEEVDRVYQALAPGWPLG